MLVACSLALVHVLTSNRAALGLVLLLCVPAYLFFFAMFGLQAVDGIRELRTIAAVAVTPLTNGDQHGGA